LAYYLRQIQRIVADSVEDEVLQLVDRCQQVIAQSRHGDSLFLLDAEMWLTA
jgi:hypothetical protein